MTPPADRSSAILRFNPHVQALPLYNAGMSLDRARALSGYAPPRRR